MRIISSCGVVAALALAGCQTQGDAVPGIYFEMYLSDAYGGHYDPTPFNQAWTAARADPALGVAYTFPLITEDMAAGTQVRLVAGRSSNDPGYPETTGDDVILADERYVASTAVDEDGRAEFAPLTVATGAWTSDTGALPADLLCGTTVIAARAYAPGDGEVPSYRFLASTFFIAVTDACD